MQIECGKPGDPVGLIKFGPTVAVHIGLDPKYKPGENITPNLPEQHLHALVDTGALESCIDSGIARSLNLPVMDRKEIAGVLGLGEVDVYLAQIYIPALKYIIYGEFAGVHLRAGGQPYNALLGRTFLAATRMVYDGKTGSVLISK